MRVCVCAWSRCNYDFHAHSLILLGNHVSYGSFFFHVHHLWTESYLWPGSCTVESLLISSCQIFQAAFIFKKSASQAGAAWSALRSRIHRLYLLYQHSPIYSSWFCLRPIPVRSLLRDFHSFHSDLCPGASCSLVGIGSFARCCFAICCSSHNASLAVWGGCDSGWQLVSQNSSWLFALWLKTFLKSSKR